MKRMRSDAVLHDLCGLEDVAPDVPFRARLGDVDVAIFQLADGYYATADRCTHGPGSISEGWIEGNEVECPFHQGRFCIVTGQPTAAPCTVPLQTWPVVVRDGRICVEA